MDLQSKINVLLSATLVLSNIALLALNYKNIKQIKELSSPKPFLKPTGFTLNKFSPVITIENYGSGHAVNVSVDVLVNVINDEAKLNEWVRYNGDNFIPYIEGNNQKVNYRYDGEQKVLLGEELKVKIKYESDSGAKGEITWKIPQQGKSYELIEGR